MSSTCAKCYHFRIVSSPATVGYVLPFVAEVFGNQPGWECNNALLPRNLTLTAGDDVTIRTAAVAKRLSATWPANKFEVLKGWRDELKDVYSSKGKLVFLLSALLSLSSARLDMVYI